MNLLVVRICAET